MAIKDCFIKKEEFMRLLFPQVAEALHTNQARISDYENGKRGTDPDLIEKLKKRYKLIIQYNA